MTRDALAVKIERTDPEIEGIAVEIHLLVEQHGGRAGSADHVGSEEPLQLAPRPKRVDARIQVEKNAGSFDVGVELDRRRKAQFELGRSGPLKRAAVDPDVDRVGQPHLVPVKRLEVQRGDAVGGRYAGRFNEVRPTIGQDRRVGARVEKPAALVRVKWT